MNDCIGHDIDGRPLRVGDEVVIVSAKYRHELIGTRCKVVGRAPEWHPEGSLETNIEGMLSGLCGLPEMFRKLHNDHRPADESFTEIMGKLKGEVVCQK